MWARHAHILPRGGDRRSALGAAAGRDCGEFAFDGRSGPVTCVLRLENRRNRNKLATMRHEDRDRASLELATLIADGLIDHPEWIELARANLARWSQRNRGSPGLLRCYAEWSAILERPVSEIRAVLTAETDEGQRLRQNSPFAGALSPQQVWEVKRRHAATRA